MFNYFPTKEDLFYSRLEAFEERAADGDPRAAAGRERARRVRRLPARPGRRAGHRRADDDAEATEQIRTVTRIITESPALLARERQVFDRYAGALAALLAEETGAEPGDVVCRAVANALLGLHRALIDHVRAEALAGASAARDPSRASRPRPSARSRSSSAGCGDFGVSPS